MEKIIVYGSRYGATARYADFLSERTGTKALPYTKIKDLSGYNAVLYLGGLYAGGVLGLSKTIKRLDAAKNQALIIATVGLADPKVSSNIESIRRSISKQLPQELYNRAEIFHLRGAIDYQRLGFIHKVMMGLLYKKVEALPPQQQTAETRALIGTYNKRVDFVDTNSLDDIIKAFLQL